MSERYSNKRLLFRDGGRFRKAQASDVGIGGVCPTCSHILIRVYDGDTSDTFQSPALFRNRCFTCEPEAKMTPEQIADLAAEIAADVRDETFEGDKWLGFAKTRDVVAERLAKELK